MRILRSWRLWAASLIGGTLLTALATAQTYSSRLVEGLPASWRRLYPIQAIDWYAWALLAPFVVAAAAALPWRAGHRARLISIWAALAFVFSVAHASLEVASARTLGVVGTTMPVSRMLPARFASTMAPNLIVFSVLVFGYYAAAHFRELQQREQRAAVLEARLAEAQLESLRRQLQPHFLFNALHTVSALISEDTGAARRVLARLGELLRLSLDHAESQEVTLAQELKFLDSYLDIQRTRFRDRLTVVIDAGADVGQALVPSLMLQLIVENSVRHAIEPRRTPGRIEVRAWREGSDLRLSVRDDGPGLDQTMTNNEGIGLANTRARLEQLYASRQSLTLTNDPGGGVRVDVSLPFHSS